MRGPNERTMRATSNIGRMAREKRSDWYPKPMQTSTSLNIVPMMAIRSTALRQRW